MLYHPRFHHFGGGVNHTAKHPVRSKPIPLGIARVDGGKARPLEFTANLVEVPPGHTVHATDDRRIISDQRCHFTDHWWYGMRLEGDNDVVLHAQIGWGVRAGDSHCCLAMLFDQAQAVGLHGRQMWTARHEADIGACLCQLYPHVAANRACPENTDFHSVLPEKASPSLVRSLSQNVPFEAHLFVKSAPIGADLRGLYQPKLFCHADTLHFARRPFRYFIEDHHFAWDFEIGHAIGCEIADGTLIRLFTFAQDHSGRDLFAKLVMRQRKGHDLRDRRVIHQHPVHFKWGDLFAAAVDDLLEPPCEVEEAILVQSALIASSEPTLVLRHEEAFGIGLGVAFITRGDVRTGYADFANPVDQAVFAFMADRHIRTRRNADGAGFLHVQPVTAHLVGGFRHAISLDHWRVEGFVQRGHHLCRQ